MGQLPAIVIIARHGARLDAADNQWHLTSPTPYDPPLTYGGWTQSRALGARIASILQAREITNISVPANALGSWSAPLSPVAEATNPVVEEEGKARFGPGFLKRRKHKVIIHTSPYLRCLQTSIAISAGMAQYHGAVQTINDSDGHNQGAETTSQKGQRLSPPEPFVKPILRVDAFLGEWLNPDYFEFITPPPNSVMMVAAAKAELLRRGDYSGLGVELASGPATGFPGGWGSAIETDDSAKDGSKPSLSNRVQAMSRRDRTGSHSTAGNYGSRLNQKSPQLLRDMFSNSVGYVAPTPSYAVSSSDPIPPGYVAHARDACIEVDYQWDSMREPLAWGNGGEYGEEWGTMHRRCRKALQKMLSWYRSQDLSDEIHDVNKGVSGGISEDDFNAHGSTDTVLILVSHGAACNAFIGGLTDSPVLLDVGMASLTLAQRKDPPKGTFASISTNVKQQQQLPTPPPLVRRRSSMSLPASAEYEVKLIASNDHLRAGPSRSTSSQLQTSHVASSSRPSNRHRYGSSSSTIDESASAGERAARSATSSALGSIRRSSHSSSPIPLRPSCRTTATDSSNGLWSRPPSSDAGTDNEMHPGDDMVLNFNDSTSGDCGPDSAPKHELAHPEKQGTHHGLWGSSAEVTGITEREKGPKRRWTVNEQVV